MDFDLILAGGGLANSLIALRLAELRPELRVGLVEGGQTIGGNHTWSSFEADITPAQVAWTAPLIEHRWDRYSIRFPTHVRTLIAGYRSATSARLATAIAAALPADRLLLDSPIVALTPTSVTLADQRVLTAGAVIDGRGHSPSAALDLRAQKFLGLEVELTGPHGLDGPIIMDATVPQLDGYRFVYTLPFGPRRCLVEDTYYSDGGDLAPDVLRTRIFDYIKAQGWQVARVIREETGVLPIALDGDIAAFWDADGALSNSDAPIPAAGMRAALFNPITGYSFPDAVRTADLVAALPDLGAPAVYAALRHHSESTWGERKYYRLLNRMLFHAAEPAKRYKVLQRFYRLDAGLVRRFYAGQSTAWEKLRILVGKPPVPVGRAIDVLLKSRG